MNVTTDEILDAIRDAMAMLTTVASPPGITTTEAAAALGCTIHGARRHLRTLLANGTMEPTRVRRVAMSGLPCEVPGYRLKS